MGTIWIKSVDPNRAICSCAGLTGPCASCSPCSGLRFNNTTQAWDVFNLTLPGNCIIAQDAIDSYVKTSSSVTATVANALGHRTSTQTVTFRANGIAVYIKSGDIFQTNLSNVVTTDSLLYAFSVAKAGAGFSFNANYYSGHVGNLQNRNADGTVYGTVLQQDLTNATLPTNLTSSLYSFGGGFFPFLSLSATEYASDFYGNLYFTGLVAPLALTSTASVAVPKFTNYTQLTGPYTEISYASVQENGNTMQKCWKCVGASNTWTNQAGPGISGFGVLQSDTDLWNQFVKDYIANERTLTNGNRGLGFNNFQISSDTNSTSGTFITGPVYAGIPCAPGNDGQVLCYDGFWTLIYYYSTNWPTTSLSSPFISTNSFRIQATKDICLDIVPGYGGLYPSMTFTNTVNTQSITGNSYITDTIQVLNETQALNITPIFFYTGNRVQITCPFTLP